MLRASMMKPMLSSAGKAACPRFRGEQHLIASHMLEQIGARSLPESSSGRFIEASAWAARPYTRVRDQSGGSQIDHHAFDPARDNRLERQPRQLLPRKLDLHRGARKGIALGFEAALGKALLIERLHALHTSLVRRSVGALLH